jgi:transposase
MSVVPPTSSCWDCPTSACSRPSRANGELEVTVETTATRRGCPDCGVVASLHDRRETVVRDVCAFGRRARLRWRKRLWRCPERACPRRTWTERSAAIRPRFSLTEQARKAACRQGRQACQSAAAVARALGSGWHMVMRAVRDHGEALVEDPASPDVAALGMDEASWLRANRRHHTL